MCYPSLTLSLKIIITSTVQGETVVAVKARNIDEAGDVDEASGVDVAVDMDMGGGLAVDKEGQVYLVMEWK